MTNKCPKCRVYTSKDRCPICGEPVPKLQLIPRGRYMLTPEDAAEYDRLAKEKRNPPGAFLPRH